MNVEGATDYLCAMAHNVVSHSFALGGNSLETHSVILNRQHSAAPARSQFNLDLLCFAMLDGVAHCLLRDVIEVRSQADVID